MLLFIALGKNEKSVINQIRNLKVLVGLKHL